MSPPGETVLFYVQHLLGIGHLMRATRIALALQNAGFAVTLVTGGVLVTGFKISGLTHVALPSMAVQDGDFSHLVDAQGKPVDEAYRRRRCELLLQTYHRVRPSVVILEAYPFGRRQLRFELLPLIDAIEMTPAKPLLLSSVRDILQKRSKPERDRETATLINRYFDAVLVHGDPGFVRLEESFPLAAEIANKLIYTGLIGEPRSPVVSERCIEYFDVVVSAGGGAVGVSLINAALEAAHLLPESGSWCVITGPNLSAADYSRLCASAPAAVQMERFRSDLPTLLGKARVSVSQAGYNTVVDLLRVGCVSVLVPYSRGGETEQAHRAARLEELGLARVLAESSLSGEALASAIQQALRLRARKVDLCIDLNGVENTAAIVRDLLLSNE